MTRFCYNNGATEITPSDIVLLYCIADFMEMDGSPRLHHRQAFLSLCFNPLCISSDAARSARQSHDRLYQAIAVYFKRHTDLYEQEKLTICCALNYKKLSAQALKQVSKHSKFPSRRAVEAFKDTSIQAKKLAPGKNAFQGIGIGYVFGTMQTQVTNVIKSRVPFRGTNIGYLPKLFP
ncbi:hypothetical protein M0R45_002487 [Rubus argutus]|uniref:NPH3 domain-containing protein n=1 Tax=Rubus argutus TaxID=59490 RepID=A0AAW1VT54_RUBAR